MSVAMAPTMDTFTIVDGMKGPMTSPEPMSARDCPRKVGGAMLMILSATRARSPLFDTAALMPIAAMRSHTVVPENCRTPRRKA